MSRTESSVRETDMATGSPLFQADISDATEAPGRFDLVFAADMTLDGDCGLRITQECRVAFDMGLRVGLLHIASNPDARLCADVQGLVRAGMAHVLDLSGPVDADLVVVHAPAVLSEFSPQLKHLAARRVVLVHDRAPDPATMGRWFGLMFGKMSWAPVNRWVRAELEALRLPIEMEPIDWRPPVAGGGAPPLRTGRRLSIGVVANKAKGSWPATEADLAKLLPQDGSVDVHILGGPPSQLLPGKTVPQAWTLYKPGDIAIERFVGSIDVLAVFPSAANPVLPDAAIATAMAAGKLVLTSARFRAHFGPSLVYCEVDNALETAVALLRDEQARLEASRRAMAEAKLQFSADLYRERLARLLGRHVTAAPHVQRHKPVPTALFVPSNGVGLGHVSRLLAIANRAEGRFKPVFASLAQVAPTIESFGYTTHYLPSLSDTGAQIGSWDSWFRLELERIVYGHDAQMLVFDGNNPTPGLIKAALSQPPCKLAWIRRGMNKSVPSPYLDNARFFDLIIEPGELAGDRDTGPTAARRDEAVLVEPIRLLDHDDLLGRAQARAELGLDPQRPAVLVQLGGNAHRDVLSLTDAVVKSLRGFRDIQIVLAEWANGTAPMSLWPDTTVISGFPLSRYFNAFDFSVAGAGYNTFHEAIEFGLPSVFIGNTHGAVDDQVARARYAQDVGAGLELPQEQLFQLPSICEILLNERARDVLRSNCRNLARPNGAARAAELLAGLVDAA